MNDVKSQIFGHVAQIISDDELVLNVGYDRGVRPEHVFEVIDPNTLDVKDPKTGANLGSIKRVKARIKVYEVAEHVSLARSTVPSSTGIEALSVGLFGTRRRSLQSSGEWPEGVVRGDPVVLLSPLAVE